MNVVEQRATDGAISSFGICHLCYPSGRDQLLEDPCIPVRTTNTSGGKLHRPSTCGHGEPRQGGEFHDGRPDRASEDDDRTLGDVLAGMSVEEFDEYLDETRESADGATVSGGEP